MNSRLVTCPSCKARTFIQDQPWKLVCVTCYLKAKGRTAAVVSPAGASPVPPDMLRRLIQLCHPDKHHGSEAATTATAYLLALRKGAAHG